MQRLLKEHFWIFAGVVIALCAYFAASATTQFIAASLPAPRIKPSPAAVSIEPVESLPFERDVTKIVERNIFCSTCEAASAQTNAAAESQEATNSNEPVRTSLNLRLIATLISDHDKAWSFAAIEETSEKKTRLYAIGHKVNPQVTVVDIMEKRVYLDNGGRNEFVDLESGSSPSASSSTEESPMAVAPVRNPIRNSLTEGLEGAVRKLGDTKYEIQRSALNKVLSNTTLLARSARIVPSMKDGKADGFKLYAVRPGSVYSLIGLQNGDTIHAVNGHSIDTPDKALEVYTRVRNASYLTISFSRNGKTTTHDYVIR